MPTRVLVVDDDPEFASALQKVLQDAGMTVRVADDGADALSILNRNHGDIDVTIVDLNLPHISGFEIIGAIARRDTVMRVFATSGVYRETYLEIAQHLGAHIAVRKPRDLSELKDWVSAIRSILKAEDEMGSASGALS